MAFETFEYDSADGDTQDSDSIAIAAGEAVRVRFSSFPGALAQRADAFLVISANGIDSPVRIDNTQAWASGAVAEGDTVLVRVKFDGAEGIISGVVEGFAS